MAYLGDQTVPVAPSLLEVLRQVEAESIAAIVMERYKQVEPGEAMERAGIRTPLVWCGMRYRNGNEDAERLRRAVFNGKVKTTPSLLLSSAFAVAVSIRDPPNTIEIEKARSTGRIDAASATVLAVAEGVRQTARPQRNSGRIAWA